MVGVVRIAAIDARHVPFGQLGLDTKDGLRAVGCLRVAQEVKHTSDVIDVLVAQRLRLLIVFEVVVAIRKAEAALVDAGDRLRRVLCVLFGSRR